MKGTDSGLPWSRAPGENRRLFQVGAILLLLFVPAAIMIPLVEVPEPTREERETLPPQLARLMEEPEPVVEPEPEPDPEPVEPDPDADPEPDPDPEPAPEEPQETVEEAREAAAESGLMAMRDELAGLRDMADSPEAAISDRAAPGEERPTDLGEPDADGVLAGSGGPAPVGRGEAEEAELARRDTTELEAEDEEGAEPPDSPDERPMANIREVFDRNKSALFSIYNRALRQDPGLEGEVVLKLVISGSGEVASVEVVESELGDPELAERIASRVRMFSFGEMDVPSREVRFPVDFLPP